MEPEPPAPARPRAVTALAPRRPELRARHGAVASTHWLASGAGMAMLERGGNAFDAAAATGFVLQVVEPHMNGLGGEAPILLWSAERERVEVVCGQGPAPAGATTAHFRELGLDLIPYNGLLATCVPAAFGAWLHMLAVHGRLELDEILEPAIAYARDGFPVSQGLHDVIATVAELFRLHWPTSARRWLPDGSPPPVGSILRSSQLAATYQALVDAGRGAPTRAARIEAARRAFYEGFVAEEIDRFVQSPVMDGSGRTHSGVLTGEDLARFAVAVEEPLTIDYAGVTVCKPATWTQGLVLLQQLALLARTDIAQVPRDSGRFAHLVVEAAKLAFADREAWYGDPAFVDVPVDDLLSPAYSAQRARLIGEQASFELRPGAPGGRRPRLPDEIDGVADRAGPGVGEPTIPALGFCLGSRAQMFWLGEGLPGSLAPGKRPRSTLSPSLALRDGRPWLAFGTPGGDFQDQWSLVFLLTLLHHEPDAQAAIDAATFHTLHAPSSFYPRRSVPGRIHVEGHTAEEAVADLRARGHDVVVDEPWSQGQLSAVGVDPASGWLRAAANPRGGQGHAVGR